jgi:hypothetical protein
MFFARSRRMPPAIRRAIASVDHFSASLDTYHEREVPRSDTFAALRVMLDLVPAVSLHLTATDDAYVDDVLSAVRRTFGDRVPALVSKVQPTGRARSFLPSPQEELTTDPCEFAAWPLVDYDGTVFACCRQSIARRYRPGHLVLGHAAQDSWAQLRARSAADPVLRAVRAFGPVETARRTGATACDGYCATCVTLTDGADVSPGVELMAQQLLSHLRPSELARRWGAGRHGDMVELGWGKP